MFGDTADPTNDVDMFNNAYISDVNSIENQCSLGGTKRPSSSLLSSRDPRKLLRQENLTNVNNNSDSDLTTNISKTTHAWQTLPIIRSNKIRQPALQDEIPLQNRFSDLPIENVNETSTSSFTKEIKPPPIMLYGITDILKLSDLLETVVNKCDYTIRTINNKQIKISPISIEAYKKVIQIVRNENLIGHTFTRKDEKSYRVVLKNLHYSTPVELIKEEVEKHGHIVRGNIVNAHHRVTKSPLPMFFINLEPQQNNKDIFSIKYISNCVVLFEPPRKTTHIAQCKRCQQYGHTRNNCMRPYRCVKCAQAHDTKDCLKADRNTSATCALCLGEHPANYKGCRVYKEILDRKMKGNLANKISQPRQFNTFIDRPVDKENFPPLRKQHFSAYNPKENSQSYADILKKPSDAPQADDKLNRLSHQIEVLVQQMGTLMNLLTTVITKLCK